MFVTRRSGDIMLARVFLRVVQPSAVENDSWLSKLLPTHFPSSTLFSIYLFSVLHLATGAIDACAYAIAQIDDSCFVL